MPSRPLEPALNAPAYQADGQVVPRETFYAIACDPQRSVVVEACAGAGKTWMLVSRILRALLEGAQPNEILAITFTRKAAGEMRERLNEWLHAFSSSEASDAQRVQELLLRGVAPRQAQAMASALAGLHAQLLETGRAVEIRTFHAWFSQLLRAAPMDLLNELGLAPGMEVLDELSDHMPGIYRRFHAAVVADADLQADYRALVQARGRDQVRVWLDAALDKRIELALADDAGVLEDSVPAAPGTGHPQDQLQSAAWQAALRELARELGQGGAKSQKAADALVEAVALPDSHAMYDAIREALFTKTGTPRKLGELDALGSMQAELDALQALIEQQAAHLEHMRLVRLSRVLLRELAAYKRSRGIADMADLERCALALLRDSSGSAWVQERLDMRIRHVLIDEFQDTSPLQWHALHSWLSAYAGAGGGASGQRPPGVFIVGDPKQSIYRFRRAEPKVFAAARDFVCGGLEGVWLTCDHTRRNAPQVLDAVNEVFGTAAAAGEFEGFRSHTTELAPVAQAGVMALPSVLRPAKAEKADAPLMPWRDTLTMPRHEPETVLRAQEAAWVARAIQALVRNGEARYDEVFVLSRTRASLRHVAQALQEAHVPFAASETDTLMDSPEVRDLVAVLDVLASPSHRLSLAHALRSPLFGASDDDLLALATQVRGGGDWWRAVVEADHTERPALRRARDLLTRWYGAASRLPPHDLLDRIVFEGEFRERVVAVAPPERRVAALNAIDALLAQALMLDGARYATPYNFVRAIKRRAIKVAAPAERDAVQLLTVHGAKGLEAKVVFLMDTQPESSRAGTATLLIDWPVERPGPARCAFLYSESRCPPALKPLMAQEADARRREEMNVLYVAMTRARERFVLSRTEPYGKSASSWWDRLAPHAQAWVPDARSSVGGVGRAASFSLRTLPRWVGSEAPRTPSPRVDLPASRFGSAVHRTLEWSSAAGQGADIGELAAAAAAEFRADPAEVARMAAAIWHSPDCQPYFHGDGVLWAGNEVPVAEAGEALRIDRLVALNEDGQRVWWVLDYKTEMRPQDQPVYREQLLRYRAAVMALEPGETVRCALINGAGSVIEVTAVFPA